MKKLLIILLCLPLIGLSQKAKDLGYVQNWAGDYNTYWYVLGWSVDGHVALLEIQTDDMFGGCSYEIVIQNMKTDNIVENYLLHSVGDNENEYYEEYECDSAYVITKYYDIKVKKLFEKYKIIENDNNKFYRSSIVNNNFEIIFQSKDTPVPDSLGELDSYNGCELYWCGNRPVDYSLTIKDSRNKSKILTKGTDWCASDIYYVGYFKSPFEPRILTVIYSRESDASERYYSTYRFVGCSLKSSTFK